MLDKVSVHYKVSLKSKSKVVALDEVSLRVPSGVIYGLLGPSGCGKTTALSCCLGIQKPATGQVRLFGRKPHSAGSGCPGALVGYMPQTHSLYPYFTSEEILAYYGTIFGVKNLKTRINQLLSLLELKDGNNLEKRQLSLLSGGQQRRLSMACAMIHEPKIIVL